MRNRVNGLRPIRSNTTTSGKDGVTSGREFQPRVKVSAVSDVRTHPARNNSLRDTVGNDEHQIEDYINKKICQLLGKFKYYHGLMPREECEQLLENEGDFLLRYTKREDKKTRKNYGSFVISVMHNDEIKHIPLTHKRGQWYVNDLSCNTISELITTLITKKHKLPSNAVLISPVKRPDYYILHENVVLGKLLGAGAFGEVYQGVLRGEDATEKPCAIKRSKGDETKKDILEFMKEANTMRRFNHANIVRFYGVAAQESPVMIVIELAEGGSLSVYCNKEKAKIGEDRLMAWATDAARGMAYLHANSVLHCDLAARNCLLGRDAEIKISDFGKSLTNCKQKKLTRLKMLPIKWSAPEVLTQGLLTTQSDVWSFGVLLWEIFSKCATDPFPGQSNAIVKPIITNCQKGDLLPVPSGTPQLGATVMQLCWTFDPAKRPSFVELLKMLSPNEEPPVSTDQFQTYT